MIPQRRNLTEHERYEGTRWLNRIMARICLHHDTNFALEIAKRDYADYAALRILDACKDLLMFNG